MSTVYRKSGSRQFYRIEDSGVITVVLLKEYWAEVKRGYNIFLKADLVGPLKEPNIHDATEEEFNTAYKEALERITTGKI